MTEQPQDKTLIQKISEENIAEIYRKLKEPNEEREAFKQSSDSLIFKCSVCGKELPNDDTRIDEFCDSCRDHPAKREFIKNQKDLTMPITDDDLKEMLGSSIKHDDDNKVITFLSMLATYTEEDQINIGFLAGSSTGKSYIPLEIAIGYFPKSDLIILAYCSPTAFFHDYGVMLPDPTDRRDVEPEKRRKIIHVDLERKIIIFLDQPHMKLLENLRPLLSHDQKEITVKISDRREKSGLRAKTVVIRGFPTVIFCSANYKQNEQEKTRMLILSPEHTQEKLRETISLRIQKESDREAYKKQLEEDTRRTFLGIRVDDVKLFNISQVIIPEETRELIFEKFMENREYLQSRHQRDISRLMSLIKGYALLNFYQRNRVENKETGQNTITATLEDIEIGFKYYSEISQANELGIPPEVYEIYIKLSEEKGEEGFKRKDFQKEYCRLYHKHIGRGQAASYLESLSEAGLVTEEADENDRRSTRYVCTGVGVAKAEEKPNVIDDSRNLIIQYLHDTNTPTPQHTYLKI